jgi:hypothetical protein
LKAFGFWAIMEYQLVKIDAGKIGCSRLEAI